MKNPDFQYRFETPSQTGANSRISLVDVNFWIDFWYDVTEDYAVERMTAAIGRKNIAELVRI